MFCAGVLRPRLIFAAAEATTIVGADTFHESVRNGNPSIALRVKRWCRDALETERPQRKILDILKMEVFDALDLEFLKS